MTDLVAGRPCLVLAPHPDDETLGCAATIMCKREAGTEVTVAIVTDGRHGSDYLPADELAHIRREEVAGACRILGVPQESLIWMGLEDGTLAGDDLRLDHLVSDLVERFDPSEVLTTSVSDPHPDHAALGRAVRRSLAGRPDIELYEFPVWQWNEPRRWISGWPGARVTSVRWALPRRPALVRTSHYLERKVLALSMYRSQLHPSLEETAGGRCFGLLEWSFLANFFQNYEVFLPVASVGHTAT
ncbi:MAG: PIG-L deacetylase family protein [Acidimicrobiales bacterium]